MDSSSLSGTVGCDMKTAFLVFRTEEFDKPVGDTYVFDRCYNVRASGESAPKVSVQRNLWSYTVEAILEYSRICFDLFSVSKPISVINVESEEKILSVWYPNDQTLEAVWKVFSGEATSSSRLDFNAYASSTMPGLFSCRSVLQLPTPKQSADPSQKTNNCGRVILIGTNISARLPGWVPALIQQIKQPPQAAGYLPIERSDLVFVDIDSTLPMDAKLKEDVLVSSGHHRVSCLRVPVTSRSVYLAVMYLSELKLGLASTLVQEIPMKEEANVSSGSTMYGVELIHEAKAHEFLHRLGLANRLYIQLPGDGMEFQQPPSGLTKTLGINWVTPRSADPHLIRYSIGAYRVTMAAVGNRASVCLAQFVLGDQKAVPHEGRCVVLAHKLHDDGSVESSAPMNTSPCYHPHPPGEVFLLLCHGSVMYLHVLAVAAGLSHPPLLPVLSSKALLESSGFRVAAFVKNFMNPARLAPASANSSYAVPPKVRALQHVERCTRYMPLKLGSTILGGNTLAAPLFEHLPKDFLESAEVAACESAIDLILEFIQGHPVLKENVPSLIPTQPVAMALELDYLLKQYADISEDHALLTDGFKKKMEAVVLGNYKRLSRLVTKAEGLLSQGMAPAGSALSQLTELAEALSQPGTSQPPSKSKKQKLKHHDNNGLKNEGESFSNIAITPCPPEVFMKHLLAPTRKPLPTRAEFAGVLNGNSKAPLRLYAAREEK